MVLDGGAYTSFGVITAYYAGSMLPTLYKIPNYKYDGTRVYTNLPASGAFRGHGVPQPRFAFESLLDMIAEDLGLDPIEIRLRNAMEPNTRTVQRARHLVVRVHGDAATGRARRPAGRRRRGSCRRARASASAAAASCPAPATRSTGRTSRTRTR